MKRLIDLSMAIVLLIGLLPAATAAHQPATDEPDISITPASLTAEQCPDTQTTQMLHICNVGPVGPLYCGLREVTTPLLSEGFEDGVMPPSGWTLVQNNPVKTWIVHGAYKHSGLWSAVVWWDYNQDEWLVSPQVTLSQGVLDFYSIDNPWYCREPNDNCDLNVWIVVGEVGGGDDIYVGKADPDWWRIDLWNLSHFELTPLLPGGPVRIAFQYWGNGGMDAWLDDITLHPGIPWLGEPGPTNHRLWEGECQDVPVTFDSTGLAPGVYTGSLVVDSNDPDEPQVTVPVQMTVLEPAHDADFSWDPPEPVAGLEVTFTGSAQGSELLEYTWDFGDGGTGSGQTAGHTYAEPGTYVVTLTATNACDTASVQHEVTVYVAVNTLHINKSKMNWAAAARPGYYKLVFSARIHDDQHAATPGATVLGIWTYPDGSTHEKQTLTDSLGRCKFAIKEPQTGEYTFCITDIQKAGYAYDPQANENPACRTVTVAP